MTAQCLTAPPSQSGNIPNASTWEQLTQSYRRVHAEYYGPGEGCSDSEAAARGGFVVPHRAQSSPRKGTDIFSAGAVGRGQAVVQDGPTAEFETEAEWRRFLALLPPALARDVASWAYVVENPEDLAGAGDLDTGHVVMLDLYAGSAMNHGHTAPAIAAASPEFANLMYEDDDGDDGVLRASRDIGPGEEFLIDYTLFHIKDHKLTWFDRVRNELFTEAFEFNLLSLGGHVDPVQNSSLCSYL